MYGWLDVVKVFFQFGGRLVGVRFVKVRALLRYGELFVVDLLIVVFVGTLGAVVDVVLLNLLDV